MSVADAPPKNNQSGVALALQKSSLILQKASLIRVFDALEHQGDETRVVGGAIRNALLDRPVHEIDLATTAEPDAVMARARKAGLRCIPTGLEHGTVTLISDGETFEVTTLREDLDTDGRRAKVRFGHDFEADAVRRDFTMNALFLARDGELFDYVGSLEDIRQKRVRFIGDPAQRIREDYLRILRFFRFSADFGEGPIDAAGLLASLRERAGLARLSRERVRAEMFKLFCARRAAEATREMSDAGLLGPLLASAPNPARLRRLAADPEAAKDPLLALAALCLELPEDAERLQERLRLSNAEFKRLDAAACARIGFHGRDRPPSFDELRIGLFRRGRQAMLDALALAKAGAREEYGCEWEAARDVLRAEPEPRLPFSGSDLVARGAPPGPAIGKALEQLREHWVGAGFPDDAAALSRLLDQVAKEVVKDPKS
ncbi:CCA tRNA nucleotidyltransferase [Methylocapsa palsarum]|uniref:tRNA nucleotidyltransferase/poly(A) polymerase n=1 Tax=Methylocapsa palsarum TaxID=1612308 RepID=A0A1I3WUB4_9HYPH|nr:CCA tRNA nucleotidyltransferase [Methylocapsa palsarum]SFK11224.1 tRNA nucleotidyltransferase/poly(A) polymerase [Methylocapsa palsarum]